MKFSQVILQVMQTCGRKFAAFYMWYQIQHFLLLQSSLDLMEGNVTITQEQQWRAGITQTLYTHYQGHIYQGRLRLVYSARSSLICHLGDYVIHEMTKEREFRDVLKVFTKYFLPLTKVFVMTYLSFPWCGDKQADSPTITVFVDNITQSIQIGVLEAE